MKSSIVLFMSVCLALALSPSVTAQEIFNNCDSPQTTHCSSFEVPLITQCTPEDMPLPMLITSILPGEGTVAHEIAIEGDFFADGGPPRLFLVDEERFELDMLESKNLWMRGQVPDVIPAGSYTLVAEKCGNDSTGIDYEVHPPSNLVFSPYMVIHGAEVTVTGEWFGDAEGRITVQAQTVPPGPEVEAEIISWVEGMVKFRIPAAFASNGLLNVTVINGTGSVQKMGVHTLIGRDNGEGLQVTGAVATSSTELLVQFSEPVMAAGAEDPSNYQISGPEVVFSRNETGEELTETDSDSTDTKTTPDTRTAAVRVLSAELLTQTGYSTVRLTTVSQSDIRYTVSVSSVYDLTGNSFVPTSILAPNPNSAEFLGISPSGGVAIDSDGDGLSDSDEQRGWIVTVTNADGAATSRHVTSDPGNPDLPVDHPFNIAARDTDGDGVTDNEEKHGALDPRTPDTDGDTLTDDDEWNTVFSDGTNQDSDGDGAQDGFEYYTFRTSPILADTDGDQIPDPVEVSAGNRNPLIADLPAPRIRIGNVNMQLDTRFVITDESGESTSETKLSESTLTRGENETFSTSNENSTSSTLAFSQEASATYRSGGAKSGPFPSFEVAAKVGSSQGSSQGNVFSSGEESGRSSEEAYHESLTRSKTRDYRETVEREVVDAAIKVDVTIENVGDRPFSISNLEITAQTQNPRNRRELIPIASLTPENENLGTQENPINIGALGDSARGPFVFKTTSVFPKQVEELMKNPRGFIARLANFDITAEDGRNFSFISQDVLDRTAGITFDLGDGRVENFRVATASAHNRSTGAPLGITMEYALNGIVGLHRYPTIRDGGNGSVQTEATGDDEQLVDPASIVEPGIVIITAGENGVIDTTPGGDDKVAAPDYETGLQVLYPTIRDGGNGIVETVAAPTDSQEAARGSPVSNGQILVTVGDDIVLDTVPGGDDVIVQPPSPHRVLSRYRDVETNPETKSFWALFSSTQLADVDLDDIVLRAGQQYDFAYVQDKDNDGVWAREEYLFGSSDLLFNTDGCVETIRDGGNLLAETTASGDDVQVTAVGAAVSIGVVIVGPGPNNVLDSSAQGDDVVDDGQPCDILSDAEEIQEGWTVRLKGSPEPYRVYPNPVQGDSDRDKLIDDVERDCGLDPRLRDTDLDGLTDWEELRGKLIGDLGVSGPMVSRDPVTNQVVLEVTPYRDTSSNPDQVDHDLSDTPDCSLDGYATNPLSPDTDGDSVDDWIELQNGLDPNDPDDGALVLDDDGDGVPNSVETDGFIAIVNGVSSRFYSNPNDPDSDDDGLPDLLEHYLGSNPSDTDTDGDDITDPNEYKSGGDACVTDPNRTGVLCSKFADLPNRNFAQFVAVCTNADVCDNATIEGNLIAVSSKQYGTNLNEKDSDFDELHDIFELQEDRVFIIINGIDRTLTAPMSNPLDVDSDDDGWDDMKEFVERTDPKQADSDDDGLEDGDEGGRGRDPRWRDMRITVISNSFNITLSDDEGIGNLADLVWDARLAYNDVYLASTVCDHTEDAVAVGPLYVRCTYVSGQIIREQAGVNDPPFTVIVKLSVKSHAIEEDTAGIDETCTTVPETVTFTYADSGNKTVTHECEGNLEFNFVLESSVD